MRKIIGKYELVQIKKDMVVFKVENGNKEFIGLYKNINVENIKNIY